jgi:hypothetical protein
MVLRFVVLLAHAPTTMSMVQLLVSHSTQGPAERNTTSISAAVLLDSFICAYHWLQGTAVVFKGWVAASLALHVLRHFEV